MSAALRVALPALRRIAAPLACVVRRAPFVLHRTVASAATATSAAASAAAGRSGAADAGRRAWRRRLRRALLAAALVFPFLKVGWALWPLLAHGSAFPVKDPSELAELLRIPRREKMAASYWWLVSEASDRLIRDVYCAVAIVLDYARHGQGRDDWGPIHQRGADRLLQLCEVNKGIYIKLGQHIGQLEYLLPHQYVATLKVLMAAAPRDAYEDVKRVIEESFPGRTIDDLYSSFEHAPLASASLAQVHRATLRSTGQRVAVKVQHAGLRETCAADIATVSFLVHAVKAFFPRFDYTWLADEVRANLPKELDFANEASNCEAAANAFAHRDDVVVPTIMHEASSTRVLTMSFEEGSYINDVPALNRMGLNKRDVSTLLSEAFAEQIFVHGRVHADPHFANILVRPCPGAPHKPQLVLLDHGLYRTLPSELRRNYCKLWRAIIFGDERGIKRYSARMNAGGMYKLWASMLTTKSYDKLVDAGAPVAVQAPPPRAAGSAAGAGAATAAAAAAVDREREETKMHARAYAAEIGDVLKVLPRELLLILKTNDCIRSIDYELGNPINSFVISARYIQRALNADKRAEHPGVWTWLSTRYATLSLEARLVAFQVLMAYWSWFAPVPTPLPPAAVAEPPAVAVQASSSPPLPADASGVVATSFGTPAAAAAVAAPPVQLR